jgi:hypothetical protein
MPITTMLLPGSNPSSTGTTASSEAGDPIRILRSVAVPASGARRSPRRGAGGLRRDFPFRPGALRAGGFLAAAFLPDGLARVIVACAGAAGAGVAAEGVFAEGSLAAGVVPAGVLVPGVLTSDAAVTGVLVAGVPVGGVLAGAPGTGCGDEVPAGRSCVIEPSVRGVNAAGEFDLLAVDNSGEIHKATKVFLDEN